MILYKIEVVILNISKSLEDIVNTAYEYDNELCNNPKLGGYPLAAFGLKTNRINSQEQCIKWEAYFDRKQDGYTPKEAKIIEKNKLYRKLNHKLYIGYYRNVFYVSELSQEDDKFTPANNFPNEVKAYQGLITKIRLYQIEDKEKLKKMANN